VPSRAIDEVWHRWILHTTSYMAFCEDHGGYVHHHPAAGAGEGLPLDVAYERTRRAISLEYGSADARWWNDRPADCARCWSST
jgi:hypothetical protein